MAASVAMDALVASLKQCVADFQLKISNGGDADSSAAIVDSLNKELAASLVRRDEIMEYFEREVYNLEEFLERCEKINARIAAIKEHLEALSATAPSVNYEERVLRFREVIQSLQNASRS